MEIIRNNIQNVSCLIKYDGSILQCSYENKQCDTENTPVNDTWKSGCMIQ